MSVKHSIEILITINIENWERSQNATSQRINIKEI